MSSARAGSTPGPAVTFDLWHTLIYLEPDEEEAYMHRQIELAAELLEAARPLGGSPRRDRTSAREAFGRQQAAAVRAAQRGVTVTVARQYERAAKSLGVAARPERYLGALREELQRTPFLRAPHALSMLRELRQDGYRIGLLSNTVGEPGAQLRPLLRRIGLHRLIDSYTFSDEHPWTKPSRRIFQVALESLRSRPSLAVHVGDSWTDIEGARRAKLRGRILYTGLRRYGPSYARIFGGPTLTPALQPTVASLAEVPSVVRELLPAPSR